MADRDASTPDHALCISGPAADVIGDINKIFHRQVEGRALDLAVDPRPQANAVALSLTDTIQHDIIPRLLLSHRPPSRSNEAAQSSGELRQSGDTIRDLALLTITGTLAETTDFLDELQRRGITVEMIIAEILPGAARHLGWMWETDACTFVEVTYGLSRLQQALHVYAPSLDPEARPSGEGRPFLLASMPGEQHTFGISVVEEFFRRADWFVETERPATASQLMAIVGNARYDLIGLSASADRSVEQMPALIAKLRKCALNPDVRVIAGGSALLRHPEAVESLGADAVVTDGWQGLVRVERMMRMPRLNP